MKLRPFELALVVIFGGMMMAALIMLKVYQPPADPNDPAVVFDGQVTIWGVLPSGEIGSYLGELAGENPAYGQITYRQYSPEEFNSVLVNALADGRGPDLLLISHEQLVQMRPRIQPISYESYPLRDFKNNYIDGAEIFALSDGLYGMPIAVDPLVMYWNRNVLSNEGFLTAPKTWESLVNVMFPALIDRGFDRVINRSVVAMGEYGNVRNAFGIVSALLIQQGSQGVVDVDGEYRIRLRNSVAADVDPLYAAADFYTRFSRPNNSLYSWNRSFVEDRQQFIGEDLVFYFGYGSEASQIERINPNLSFDIAEMPQGESATLRRTYGRYYALVALKSSDNLNGALAVMSNLATSERSAEIARRIKMVPVYRSLVAAGSNDTIGRVTYYTAPVTFGWLNPDLQASDAYFEAAMQDINENRSSVDGGVSDLVGRLSAEYK